MFEFCKVYFTEYSKYNLINRVHSTVATRTMYVLEDIKLSENPNAIHIIEQNLNKLKNHCWSYLSINPNATHILEQNLDKADWKALCENPNSIHIIEIGRAHV